MALEELLVDGELVTNPVSTLENSAGPQPF